MELSVYNEWLAAKYTRNYRAIRRPKNYSIEALQSISRRVGMEYRAEFEDGIDQPEAQPLRGLIHICELEDGVSLSASDVASTRDGTHSGDLPRSVAVILHLGGVAIDVHFSNGNRLGLSAGQAKMVTLNADTVMSHETANGHSARTVLLHCRPEQIVGDELVQYIKQVTRRNDMIDFHLPGATWQKAHQIFSDETCEFTRDLLCRSLAQEMLVQVIAFARAEAGEAAHLPKRDIDRLSDVKSEIDRNPQGDHSVSTLAQIAGMSISTLKRKFTDLYGLPVGSYLRLVRMEEAKAALETGQMSIAQAAHIAGYQHAGNFSSAFRKCYGILPSELRAR